MPDELSAEALERELAVRFVGVPADGSTGSVETARSVVWVDRGDEVLVHLDSLRVATQGEVLVASIDLETDQTGRAAVVVPMALGADAGAGASAVVEEFARGPEILVRRWGGIVQEALLGVLTEMAEEHARERRGYSVGLFMERGRVVFRSEEER